MRHRSHPILVVVLSALTIAACGSSGTGASSRSSSASTASGSHTTTAAAPPAHTAAVTIANFGYAPKTITVAPGTRITWTNHDSTAHTATVNGVFDTGSIDPGKSGSATFTKPGTYHYICSFHPFMHGTVVVR